MEKEFATNPAILGTNAKQRDPFIPGQPRARAYRRDRAA